MEFRQNRQEYSDQNKTETAENKYNEKQYLSDIYSSCGPRILNSFTNTNRNAKSEFLENSELRAPNNEYENQNYETYIDNLTVIDFVTDDFLSGNDLKRQQKDLYYDELKKQRKVNEFVAKTYELNHYEDEKERANIAEEHKRLNYEIYGKPDYEIFEIILSNKISSIDMDNLSEKDTELYAELIDIVGDEFVLKSEKTLEDLKPKKEIFDKFKEQVELLYGQLFAHIPYKESFSMQETCDIFNEIITEEFDTEDSKIGWIAKLNPDKSAISVDGGKSVINIPEVRSNGDISYNKMRGLIAHEIGVHMMRALNFQDSGISPLEKGLNGYVNFEEGLAKAMEDVASGEYEDMKLSGQDHYVTAGLIEYKGLDFRDAYEAKWRISALSKAKDGIELTDLQKNKSQDFAYDQVQRILRGANTSPFYKDLSYLNGNMAWNYISENIDDPDLMMNLVLSGKIDLTNDNHRKHAYEAHVGGFDE